MELIGTIKKISPVQQITPTFSKRECVLLTDEMYPQTILVEFSQSRAALLDGFTEGQYVRISINLRGREWTDPRTIEAATPGAAQGAPAPANPFAAQSAPAAAPQAPQNPAPAAPTPEEDDLPF